MFPLAVACKQRCVTVLDKLLEQERIKDPDWVDNNYNHLIQKMQGTGNVWNGPSYFGADINSYLYAAYYGVISEAQLMEYLCCPENLSETLHLISSVAVKHIESIQQNIRYGCYSGAYINNTVKGFLNKKDPTEDDAKIIEFVFQIYQKIIPVVVEDELWRGDSARQYSSSIARIVRIYGVKYFTDILFAMGNDNFARSDYSVRYNRKTTLAHLLSVCVPQPDDTVEKLREALNGKQIATKRLIEAALFSPEWIPLVGQYLGIKNFEAVCYYFMAHMDERFDDKRKAIIAKYTPLTVDELNLGAFDVDWFRSAYNMVSPEEFEIFYAGLSANVKKKFDYVFNVVQTVYNIPQKFIKKLENTDFYEMRVSIGTNEYRSVLFAIDHDNIIESTRIILLNGFLKKSTKDYKKEIDKAENILNKLEL